MNTKPSSTYYENNFRDGEFLRPESKFRRWVRSDPQAEFPAEAGRYHLYVSLACPWSHRAVLLRALRKLDSVITMSVTSPIWNENGWYFGQDPGVIPDTVNGKRDIIDLYHMADPSFEGDETVPILWDRRQGTLVNNESRDLMRMFDVEFAGFGDPQVTLYPEALRPEIDAMIDRIYDPVNNGVYKAGFAKTQPAYERAVTRLFSCLDELESHLQGRRHLCGTQLTQADIALFVTLIRFDLVYYTHFKCNLRHIHEYPNLYRWLRDVYHVPGVAETCDFDHIKKHYFGSHRNLNPYGIIPIGPKLVL